jgi:hypothetical protein
MLDIVHCLSIFDIYDVSGVGSSRPEKTDRTYNFKDDPMPVKLRKFNVVKNCQTSYQTVSLTGEILRRNIRTLTTY